ncbi:hypothetical protein Ga0074812_1282 [Parafrankia irregularis]|uniref:Uncharacterized protein n=1 Tax=Parafrankia irregularis TaxID=795642 RepID=A0A0S4QW50_9ACTN|nr:hypothetical protein Ga0074812_1282 [Parafrankia irregularis]
MGMRRSAANTTAANTTVVGAAGNLTAGARRVVAHR